MNQLAQKLGLSPHVQFHDVYTLDSNPHIPRPALALLAIIPLTRAWSLTRTAEDTNNPTYAGCGPDEPVIWFKQTIGNACGSIGLLHSVINGPAAEFIIPGSKLDDIRHRAIPLSVAERADMLYHHGGFEAAHRAVEEVGDTRASEGDGHAGLHFVAFVKARGRLWELEGARGGPLDRGGLGEDEDVLSSRALELGIKRVMGGGEEGDLRFSCLALAAV
ncbi:ubiquitin carboxyl-terminal hydrolase [Aspergillus avenaceus]|uniref:Ubiquitin carboxyl-terminal hydrolase n=1 Tax=Aspergillus avenaceus TaxID=36643 RepID=A0A5N6TKK9_ASPAV|nr:ubiquitin carboxyl-terminal hydrolase [Aspergillus avenaceus]